MTILVLLNTKTRQVGWTLGFCPSCGGPEAVRVEDVIEVTSLWFVPVSKLVVGTGTRCDFCERPARHVASSKGIGLEEWGPGEGLKVLARRLNVDTTAVRLEHDEEKRLRSLLAAVEESTSVQNLDVSLGLTSGLILGGLLGWIVGLLIIPRFNPEIDRFGGVFTGILGGLTLGAVLGAVMSVLFGQRMVPLRRIRQVCDRYDIPISALEKFAGSACSRVRSAVDRLRDELAFRIPTH